MVPYATVDLIKLLQKQSNSRKLFEYCLARSVGPQAAIHPADAATPGEAPSRRDPVADLDAGREGSRRPGIKPP